MTSLAVPTESSEIAQIRFSEEDWAALDSLTKKQRAFVLEYPVDFNGAAAAKRAGYQGNDAALAVTASRLLRHPKVNPLIRLLTSSTADEMGYTREWLLKQIDEVAAELRARGDSAVPALALIAKLRGDMIERVEHDHRVVQVVINDVSVEDLK